MSTRRMTEEEKLRNTIDMGLLQAWSGMIKNMRKVRVHIRQGEYHAASLLMTEITTLQANLSLDLRSILVKQGYIESEL